MLKKYLSLISILFFVLQSKSQVTYNGNLTFYNQSMVDYFLTANPTVTKINGYVSLEPSAGSGIGNLNGLHNITEITGSLRVIEHSVNIGNLNGLENLTKIGGSIFLSDTWISDISGLQNLTHVGGSIYIGGNQLNSFSALNNITFLGGSLLLSNDDGYCLNTGLALKIPTVPGDLDYYLTSVSDTNLSALSSITSIGGKATIHSSNSTNVDGLSNLTSIGGVLSISGNLLENLNGLSHLTSLGGLSLNNNAVLTNISGLSNITSLDESLFIGYNPLLNNLNGLQNLTSLSGMLYITNNPLLTSINELSNITFNNVTDLKIFDNTNLSLCQELNICNYLMSGGTYQINNNAQGCNDFDQLMEACNLRWKNLIKGNVKFDYTNNGCDALDYTVNNVMIKAVGTGNNMFCTFTNATGEYRLFVPNGNYMINALTTLPNYTLNPISTNVSFPGVGLQQEKNFCASASSVFNDVEVSFFPVNPPRPGFDVYYKIVYTNKGTTIMNGSVAFTFDAAKMTFVESNNIPSQNGNVLTWNYSNLNPFETRHIFVKFNVFTPPTVIGGNHLVLSATINPVSGDFKPLDNTFTLNNLVVNSYDPNDKTCLQGETILVQNLGNYLNYVIRFQNTGTASAINIRVEDIIDTKLDPATFQLVDLSHPGRVQIKNNTVNFIFDNINLPDSTTDEPNSHGYISFKIKPSNAVFGSTIQNTASIFFDFNAPIITNTTNTFVNKDTDNDTVYDTVDNCITVANLDQLDTDNDGIGDVCDDDLEVNPPYAIGFDTPVLDNFWKKYISNPSYANITVDNFYDVDANGKTIKLYSMLSNYKAMLISPRLHQLTNTSSISFWMKQNGGFYTSVAIGFMKDPNNPATFTAYAYPEPGNNMELFTLNMQNYNPIHGKNLAIMVKGTTLYVDDFNYTNVVLSSNDFLSNGLKIYPNPVSNILSVVSNNEIEFYKIFDYSGRELRNVKVKVNSSLNNLEINVNDLSNGMYFIEIVAGNLKQLQKFIKK